jgi:hypothetical protein
MKRAPWEVALDFAHVGIKTHREHPVGLIIDHGFEVFERECAFKKMIEYSAGSSNDNVGT